MRHLSRQRAAAIATCAAALWSLAPANAPAPDLE